MVHEQHVEELIPAYALGSLDEGEAQAVGEHLAGCEACRMELQAYREVVDALPLVMHVSEPPARLKGAILQAVAPGATQDRVPFTTRLGALFRRPVPAWGLASAFLILVLAVSNLVLWNRVRALEGAQTQALQVLVLEGTALVPGATGSMVIGRDGQVGTLVVDGLPPLDEDQAYQLWLIENGERINGGVFSVSDKGYGSLYIRAPKPVQTFSGVGVTIEPAEGSPGPTGEKVLGADF